jgi:hypothetical protein
MKARVTRTPPPDADAEESDAETAADGDPERGEVVRDGEAGS